jgi:hypothetical protein
MNVDYLGCSREGPCSLEWVVPGFSGLVNGEIVSAVSLVNIDFTLKHKRAQLPRRCMSLALKAGTDGTDGGLRTFSAI